MKTSLYRPNPQGTPTVICEGELDAIVLSQYGVDAVTTTGGAGSLSGYFNRNPLKTGIVYIATDQDDAGNQAASELSKVLSGRVMRCIWHGGADISARLMELDIDERSKEVRRWIDGALRM